MASKRTLKDIIAYGVSLILSRSEVSLDKRYFHLWERKGFHIIPDNFYAPIPNTGALKDDLWSKHTELVGININEKKQLELLSRFVSKFKNEYDEFPKNKTSTPYEYYVNNGYFGSVDGEILYCVIRYCKPKKIFEIGSGYSTYLSAQAIMKNKEEDDSYECELVAIEPYPNEILKAGFPGLAELVPKNVQDVPLSEFTKLAENDILFIDSSHSLKIGSDVQYEYLEILPRLNKGVIVQAHDIFLPAEYPKRWILEEPWFWFWTEQYLLQAFLAFNDSFEIFWAGNYMHLKHPDKLEAAFSSYIRDDEASLSYPYPRARSFWIRRIK